MELKESEYHDIGDACYSAPSHDIIEYLSAHWQKAPYRQDQFGYRVFGYGVAISAPIECDSRGLSVLQVECCDGQGGELGCIVQCVESGSMGTEAGNVPWPQG
ncbi:hypothetical protein E2C01_026747 [Portunus trituberculatus]|uniref:Uncharacterized protein n=1 Tax=Portunus trituberculatus TaxID=210409 RepID=A0A5B7EJ68_PORTR|nr:hypothetical protein [Portunus trituberculatus]